MFSVEEEAYILELSDALELLEADKRIIHVFNDLINNSIDEKTAFFRLKNIGVCIIREKHYISDKKNVEYNKQDFFNRIVKMLYEIGCMEKWDDDFLNILKQYIQDNNINFNINSLAKWVEAHEVKIQGEE